MHRVDRVDEGIYLRNFVFGVEDSLVSTVGLLTGIAAAGVTRQTIFLTGMVLVFVEAFSMGVGSYLSESSAEEFVEQAAVPVRNSLGSALIMFISYFVAGFIPLAPYLVIPVTSAFWWSIGFSLLALFLLGMIGGRLSGLSSRRYGFRMLIIGGIAIAIGVLVGTITDGGLG